MTIFLDAVSYNVSNVNTREKLGGLLMTNEEIKVYSKEQINLPKKEGIFLRLKNTEMCEIAEYIIVFLLSRLKFLGGLSPLGLAYFTAVFPTQKRTFGIFFACIGVIAGGFGIDSLKYMGAVTIVSAFSIFLKEELKNKKLIYSLIASGSLFANGFIYVAFDGFLVYDILFLSLEAILAFFAYFAFDRSVELLRTVRERNLFEAEETVSLLILCSALILSLRTLPYCEGLAHIASISLLLLLAYSSGVQASGAGGILLGLVNAIDSPLASQTVSIYALCGFFCGLFKNKGKWAVALSFFLSNALFMIYFNSSMDRLLTVGYIGVATMMLFSLNDGFIQKFGKITDPKDDYLLSPTERLKEVLTDKISASGEAFSELSEIFGKIIETKISPELCDIDRVYDKVYRGVCKTCSMNKFCWQKKANDTYDCLGKMYDMMRARGYAIEIDAPKHFKEYCINFSEFLRVLNLEYEKFRINQMWAGKIIESRKLLSGQFGCISGVLGKIKKDIGSNFSQTVRLERKITAALDKKGIVVGNVCVLNNSGYEVTMTKNSCEGNLECSKVMAAVISEVLEVPMLRVNRKCSGDVCRLKFCEQTRFKIETGSGYIKKSAEERSGDNFSCMYLDDGRFLIVMSDGMGSGKKANAKSSLTVSLIKKLMLAGFDEETAVKLINSILISADSKEIFATVDVCIINLYTGTAQFIKSGASSSFIKSKDGLKEIKSSSLPAGVMSETKNDMELHNLSGGDYIVLATDGTHEALLEGERSIKDLVGAFTGETPQQLVDGIMSYSLASQNKGIKDDMTVFCVKISEVM